MPCLGGIGWAAHFASCPPAFGLLLYLRKMHYPTDLAQRCYMTCAEFAVAFTALGLCPQAPSPRSEVWGEHQSEVKEEPAKRAGDTNGGALPTPPSGRTSRLPADVRDTPGGSAGHHAADVRDPEFRMSSAKQGCAKYNFSRQFQPSSITADFPT